MKNKVLLLFILLIFVSSFAYNFRIVKISEGYSRLSFNDGILCLVRSKPASVLVFDESGMLLSEITLNLSYPVSAIHVAGMVYVSDYYRSSVMVYTTSGAFLKRIDVGRYPTTLRVFRDNVYVVCSGDNSVYKINIWRKVVEEKLAFDSSTLYFEVLNGKIFYMYYFDNDKTFEIREGSKRQVISLKNLRNPLKYYKHVDKEFLLGYTDGILVCLKDDKELWRINLPDYARDFVVSDDFIAVTSLLDPVISLVSHDGKLIKQIKLAGTTHKILNVGKKLIALNHLPGELYFIDLLNNRIETINVGTYAIDMVQTGRNSFVVLCSDSGELYFFSIS